MSTLPTTLSVLITGTLLGEDSAQDIADYFAGTSYCGSGGVLVPGCEIWQNVSASSSPRDPQQLTITAQILAEHTVTRGDYVGQLVTPEFVTEYITGAGDYLLGQGDLFSPDAVTVTEAQ